MPNGRSGAFAVTRSEVQQLVTGFESSTEIGVRLLSRDGRKTWLPMTVECLLELMQAQQSDGFFVDEQDHTSYIIHFSQVTEDWVVIREPTIRGALARCMLDGRPRWPS